MNWQDFKISTMFIPISFSENLMFSTIQIDTDKDRGSGFIYWIHENEKEGWAVIFTNKHVVKDCETMELRFHLYEDGNCPNGEVKSFKLDASVLEVFDHPDEDVDLCAIALHNLLEIMRLDGDKPFFKTVEHKYIPSEEDLKNLSAIESVTMIGYPNGLSDEINNFPIMRRGVTASHPAIDFNGCSEGVVDIACFPGSSGSPIFIVDEGSYIDKYGASIGGEGRLILLGILYAGPVMNCEGEIILRSIPSVKEPVVSTDMMIHLGYYVKSREILKVVEVVRERLKRKLEKKFD